MFANFVGLKLESGPNLQRDKPPCSPSNKRDGKKGKGQKKMGKRKKKWGKSENKASQNYHPKIELL